MGVNVQGLALEPPQKSALDKNTQGFNAGSAKADAGSFQDHFERVITQPAFRFRGDFACGTTFVDTPNPCLHIEGLGIIGLPLNEGEAQRISKHSAQASYSRGSPGSEIENRVEAFWDIEAARVTFRNPAWKLFSAKLVENMCESLGTISSLIKPACKFHKLSLFSSGTFSYSTEKTGFATLIIVLPSSYAGGQVQVSHTGSTKTFDFAPDSSTNICALAWYNEVDHEVKPITSGYQLALIYNVIPTSSGIPRLPKMPAAVSLLRAVLHLWSEGYYPLASDSELKIIAMVLSHKYDKITLTMDSLKGEDAHKISYIRDVAEEMGYVIGLAQVLYRNFGVGDDIDGHYKCCEKRDDEMVEITSTRISIDSLVDLDGSPIPGFTKLKLQKTNLIPHDPFEKPDEVKLHDDFCGISYRSVSDSDPDEEEYNLEHVFRQPVFFLFHKDQELSLLLSAGGVSYALQRIQDNASQDKAPENVLMVEYILQNASGQLHKSILSAVAGYAVKWNDVIIWKQVIERACEENERNANLFGLVEEEGILEACRTFPFVEIHTTLTKILDHGTTLKNQVVLIKSLRAQSTEENVSKWCSERTSLVLGSLKKLKLRVDDVPALLSLIAEKGLSIMPDVILPQIGPQADIKPPFKFWVALITGLYNVKASLAESSRDAVQDPQKRERSSFERIIDLCLDTAVRQHQYRGLAISAMHRPTTMIEEMFELVELCMSHRDVDACIALFRVVVTSEVSPEGKFQCVHRSLIAQLRQLLAKQSADLCSPPFKKLLQFLIEHHLSVVLGAKPYPPAPTMRIIGCGCQNCKFLDAFMMSNDITKEYRNVNRLGIHLEQQMLGASDIVTSKRSYPPDKKNKTFTLVINKKMEAHATAQWIRRQKEAEEFLSSIGDADMILKIMGPRYTDVCKALAGVAAFVMDPSIAGAFRQLQGPEISSTIASPSTSSASLASGSNAPRVLPMFGMPTVQRHGSMTLKRKRDDEP